MPEVAFKDCCHEIPSLLNAHSIFIRIRSIVLRLDVSNFFDKFRHENSQNCSYFNSDFSQIFERLHIVYTKTLGRITFENKSKNTDVCLHLNRICSPEANR